MSYNSSNKNGSRAATTNNQKDTSMNDNEFDEVSGPQDSDLSGDTTNLNPAARGSGSRRSSGSTSASREAMRFRASCEDRLVRSVEKLCGRRVRARLQELDAENVGEFFCGHRLENLFDIAKQDMEDVCRTLGEIGDHVDFHTDVS